MIPEREYISRRFQTYHESNGQNIVQQLDQVMENNIVGPEARLKCRKVLLDGNRKRTFLEDYVLNKEDLGNAIKTLEEALKVYPGRTN